jgi:hypothetical protein
MTLLENEQRRSQRARRKHHKQHQREQKKKQSALDAPFAISHDNQILTFHEWCQLNRISARTGRRILASGMGPTVTRLSPRRIGISVGNNATWQKSRERK